MSQQQVTVGIVLSRIDYGEADRIITFITPDVGKIRLIAKGVRRIKSKLAGGIELFSTSNLTYVWGRGDIGTLVSARLVTHYGNIVRNVDRTMLGYELIKELHRATEDELEVGYFHLLEQIFVALNDDEIVLKLIRLWFSAQLLKLNGHTPNLQTDATGAKLDAGKNYEFSFDDCTFVARSDGMFGAPDIKFLRLVFSENQPAMLAKIAGIMQRIEHTYQLVAFMQQQYIR